MSNMDETSMRVFSLDLYTLDWKGTRRVKVEEAMESKVCLSMECPKYSLTNLVFTLYY